MFRLSLLVVLATALALISGASWLVPLVYGRAFAAAVPIAQLLTAGMVAASLRQVLGDCLRGAGKPLGATVAELVSWAVAFVGLALLVPNLRTTGAALAVSASYVAALSVSILYAFILGISARQLLIPRRDDLRGAVQVVRRLLPGQATG